MHLFCNEVRIDHSRSSKVNDFGTNRKRVWYFLLVRDSNQGPIISDNAATFWLKIANFSYPTLMWRPSSDVLYGTSCLRGEVYHEETSHGGYSPVKTA